MVYCIHHTNSPICVVFYFIVNFVENKFLEQAPTISLHIFVLCERHNNMVYRRDYGNLASFRTLMYHFLEKLAKNI